MRAMNEQNNPIRAAIDDCLSGVEPQPMLRYKVLTQVCEKTQKHMPHRTALIVTLLVLLVVATALAAALSGYIFTNQRELGSAPISCTTWRGNVYFLTYDGVFQWIYNEKTELAEQRVILTREEMQRNEISPLSLLTHDTQRLYLLDATAQKLWACERGRARLVLEITDSQLQPHNLTYGTAAIVNDRIWLCNGTADGMCGTGLYCIRQQNGAVETASLRNVVELVSNEAGQLIALQRDEQKHTDTVLRLDGISGEILETLYTTPMYQLNGLAWDAVGQRLYAVVGGMISVWNGKNWAPVYPFTGRRLSFGYAVTGNRYLAISSEGISQQMFDPLEPVEPILRIHGYLPMGEPDCDYRERHPQVTIARQNDMLFDAKLMRQNVAAGDTTDLFCLRWDDTAQALFRDGLVEPLDSEALRADLVDMLPQIIDAVCLDGQLYAVPDFLDICDFNLQGLLPAPSAPQAILGVYVLNPNSLHKQEALEYLAFVAQNRTPQNRAYLKPQAAEATLAPWCAQWMKDVEQEQRALDQELGIDTDEVALTNRLEAIMDMEGAWEVSEAGLTVYRDEVATRLVIRE